MLRRRTPLRRFGLLPPGRSSPDSRARYSFRLAQLAVDRLGWQRALVALGAFHAAVGLPLHGFAIPRFPPGRERYAELNGALSAPSVLATFAPLAMAAIWSGTGQPSMVFAAVLILFLLGVLGLLMADRAQRRQVTRGVTPAATVPIPPT